MYILPRSGENLLLAGKWPAIAFWSDSVDWFDAS